MTNQVVSLREYIERIMDEHQRAIEKADIEREKAAAALRDGLAYQIQSGDAALRDHITNQVAQIRASLMSADRQQDKFEEQVKQQFASVNEFRGSLDDLGKSMATRRELEDAQKSITATMLEISKQMQELRSRLDVGPAGLQTLQSRADLFQGKSQGINASVAMAIAVATLILGVIVVAVNVLTSR